MKICIIFACIVDFNPTRVNCDFQIFKIGGTRIEDTILGQITKSHFLNIFDIQNDFYVLLTFFFATQSNAAFFPCILHHCYELPRRSLLLHRHLCFKIC